VVVRFSPKKEIQHGFFLTFQGMSERKICNKIMQKQLAWKVSNGNVWYQGEQLLIRAGGGERVQLFEVAYQIFSKRIGIAYYSVLRCVL
jgi:hypothetical protein